MSTRRAGWLVVALTLLVFAPTLALERVGFDDPWLWSDDSPLRAPSVAMLRHTWLELDGRRDLGSEYLPVRDMVVAADMALWGPHGHHAVQLALYLLTVLALGYLLIGFGLAPALAWLATLLWAIHPLHVESVAWLSERKGVLAGLFVVLCGHAWLRYRRGRGARYLALAGLCTVCATWSKAPAMFAPAVLAAFDYLLLPSPQRRWRTLLVVGALTCAAAIPVVLVAHHTGVVDSTTEPLPAGRTVLALGALGHYVASAVLARPPTVAYPIQVLGPDGVELALGALAVLASVAAFVLRGPGRPWRRAFVAWAWLWFLPISHLVVPVHIAVADRFAYLWLLTGCAAAAWAVLRLAPRLQLAAIAVLVAILGLASLRATSPWLSSLELFQRGLAASPTDARAAERVAAELYAGGHYADALAALARGLAFHPHDPELLIREAAALAQLGQPRAALIVAAHAAQTGQASARHAYAARLLAAGRAGDALPIIALAPRVALAVRIHTEALLALQRPGDAEAVARAFVARSATSAAHVILASVLAAERKDGEAAAHRAIAAALR